MAAESTANSTSPRTPGGRTTPVLVPQGALAGRPDIPLDRAVTSVGSNERSRLHLVSRTVSRSHALFVNSNGGTYVMDLASRTGVLVNAKLVRDVDLKTGDRVQIGKFLFRYRSPTNPVPTPRNEPPSAAVIVVGSPAAPIIGRVALIGRRENSEISLADDAGVSAAHAIIFQVDRDWIIRDLGSRTGTIVNDKTIYQQALTFGDRIKIGAATILFQPAKAPAAEESVAGEPIPMPVEEVATAAARAPEPVDAEEPEEFDFPLVDETEPARAAMAAMPAAPTMVSAIFDDTLVAAEHADEPLAVEETPAGELSREAAVDAPLERPIAETEVEPEPAEIEEMPLAADTPDVEATVSEPIASEHVEESAHSDEIHAADIEEPALSAETLPLELAFSPEAAAAKPAEPIVAETPAAAVEPELFDLASDEVEEPVALDETLPIAAPTPSAKIAEVTSVEFPAEKIEVVETSIETIVPTLELSEIEGPVEFDEPSRVESAEVETASESLAPSEAEAIHDSVEPAEELAIRAAPEPVADEPISVASESIAASDESTLPVSDTVAGLSEPVEPAPASNGVPATDAAVAADLPEVIFWGDPDLDAAAEEAILGAREISTPAEASELATAASSPIPVETAAADVEPSDAADSTSSEITATAPIELVEEAPETDTKTHVEAAIDESKIEAIEEPTAEIPEPVVAQAELHDFVTDSIAESGIHVHEATAEIQAPAATEAELEDFVVSNSVAEPEIHGDEPKIAAIDEPTAHGAEPASIESPEAGVGSIAEFETPIAGVLSPNPVSDGSDESVEEISFDDDLTVPDAEPAADPLAAADAWMTATDGIASSDDAVSSESSGEFVDLAVSDLGDAESSGHSPTHSKSSATDEITADVETFVGDEFSVPVEDFSPEGLVSITESAPGVGQAIVNEFIPGDSTPGVDVAHEPATVTESISTAELPETDDLLPAADADAPIEGLGELSTADALPAAESEVNIDDLEWLDDASPMESVADLILCEQTGSAEPFSEAVVPVDEAVTPTEAIIGSEEDLDFSDLDFGDAIEDGATEPGTTDPGTSEPGASEPGAGEPAAPAEAPAQAEIEPAVAEAHHEEPAGDAHGDQPGDAIGFIHTGEIKPRPGPSLFGFDFEGGSFLGGMPLQLNSPAPTTPIARAGITVFDVTAKAPTGLAGSLAPPPTRSRQGVAMPGFGIATPLQVPSPTPPRPLTPPRTAVNPVRADAAPLSLTGLGTENRIARPGAPEIPPSAKESAADRTTTTDKMIEAPRPLPPGAAAAAAKPRSLDVFSQMASPIGIEVFGGRVAQPGKVQIPDAKETRALAEAAYPGETEAARDETPVGAAYTPPLRRSKIPLLLAMIPLFGISLFGAVFSFVPSTAKIVGTIRFEGGSGQNSHQFGISQVNRLRESSIGNTARAMLGNHKIPAGFTEDPATYSKAMVDNPQAITWEPGTGAEAGTLTFEYGSVEYPGLTLKTPDTGKEQVKAVLAALQSADQDLIDIKARAQAARDAATEARALAQQNVATIQDKRKVQLQLAQDFLDPAKIDQLDKDAARLKQEWADANTKLQSSASVLADLRDPTKPMDADIIDKVKSLRARIGNLNDQIAKLRSSNGSAAPPVGTAITAATTQPVDADPFLAPLQKQADDLNLSLKHLLDVLAADAALTPEQLAENRDRQIENMTNSLMALRRTEQDAKKASDAAAWAAAAAHKQKDDADMAGAKADTLGQDLMTAQQTLKQAVEDEKDKQTALESCITVAAGDNANNSPIDVVRKDLFEPQWAIWGGSSVLVVLVLCFMIYAEATRPAVVAGVTPTAAPLVNPPLRTIPWPQPHQLEGLKAGQRPAAAVEEPEQYIGI